MNCPNCDTALVSTTYEETHVMQCDSCHGYLVEAEKLRLIKTSRDHTKRELMSEIERDSVPDRGESVKCPKCLVEKMEKRRVGKEDEEGFFIEQCRDCGVYWLDGGELARLQLDYETSSVAIDAFALKERLKHREEEEEPKFFDEKFAKLPQAPTAFMQAIIEIALIGVVGLATLFTFVLWLIDYKIWAAVSSLVLAATMGWLAFTRLSDYFNENEYSRFIFAGIIAVIEIAFLIILFTS